MSTQPLKISGMMCDGCAESVHSALQQVSGVTNAEVDLQTGTAQVSYDPAQADRDQLVAAVQNAGYQAQIAG